MLIGALISIRHKVKDADLTAIIGDYDPENGHFLLNYKNGQVLWVDLKAREFVSTKMLSLESQLEMLKTDPDALVGHRISLESIKQNSKSGAPNKVARRTRRSLIDAVCLGADQAQSATSCIGTAVLAQARNTKR